MWETFFKLHYKDHCNLSDSVNPKDYLEFVEVIINNKKEFVLANKFPIELYFLKNFKFILNYLNWAQNQPVYSLIIYPRVYFLLSFLLFNSLFIKKVMQIELYFFTNINNNNTICVSWCASQPHMNIFFFITNIKSHLESLTSFLKGSIWLERELKEFSSLSIRGLRDSRRLLLDYTFSGLLLNQPNPNWNNYNQLLKAYNF